MTALKDKLQQITEFEAKIEAITAYKEKKNAIEEKKKLIEGLKKELLAQADLVANVDSDLKDMMSRSASRSKERRGGPETVDIDESVSDDQKRVEELNAELEAAEEVCDIWGEELSKLEEDLDTVSLDDLSQLENDLEQLKQEKQSLEDGAFLN